MKYPMIRRLTAAVLAGASTLALATPTAYAQTEAADTQARDFDIQAQDLAAALEDFGRQGGKAVIYDRDRLVGAKSRPVKGRYTADEALRHMLTDSGLTFRAVNANAFVVEAGQENAGEYEAGQGPARSPSAKEDEREIVVTGSIIRGAAPSGANLIVLGREDLDNTGRGTLAEAIQSVPQVHGGGANDATMRAGIGAAPNAFGATGAYGTTSLNLRGLGVEETLTLLNGRRLAPAGIYGAFADISALPMAAVERVEILADGASATYGADAMAGVVNIIMNRRFEGAETRLRAGLETRSGQPEFQASQTFGWAFDRGNILLSADYARRDGITAKGRPYAASADLRPFGGNDYRYNICSPGNIVNTPGLNGAIPAGQDGWTLTPDQIRLGETRFCDSYPDSSYLTPETEKGSFYITGSYDITDRIRISANVTASHRRTENIGLYQFSYLTVPTSNAFRQMNGFHGDTAPLNQDIEIAYLFTEVDPITYNEEVRSLLASVDADYRIGTDWQLSFTGTYGRYGDKGDRLELDTGRLNQALASNDPTTAFNPFGDGSANSRDLVESFLYPVNSLTTSSHQSATLNLSGSLFDLPGGTMKLAVGGDYRRENLKSRTRLLYPDLAPGFQEPYAFEAGRDVMAAYTELFMPIISDRNTVAGARRLSISLSGRYDHYSDFGGTFNPKAGVTWVPMEGLTLKGSYGTSFKAPLLTSLYRESTASFSRPESADAGAPDVNGDGFVSMMYVNGGNPDLGPEKGRSWTAGVEIKPVAISGLRLHATYFNLRFTGRFGQSILYTQIFAEPAAYLGITYFPTPTKLQIEDRMASVDRVSGDVPPADSIDAIIDQRTMNFASQVMDGVDAGVSYRWEALGGMFNLSGDVSYISRYKSRLGQSVTVTSYLGNVGLPTRWKARGGLGWAGGGVSLNGAVNHTASYMNKMVTPHEPVSSYTTIDLSAQVQLGGWARGLIGDGASLAIYVANLLDQAPPFVNNRQGVGYDGANADPIGRRIAVQLTKRW